MKKRIIGLLLTACAVASCTLFLTACFPGEKADTTLYHLTLSSNVDGVQQKDLKATYAYACQGTTVTEGVRSAEEIADLLDAGATQENIDKAGKRQADGSYYFFDADPMYLEAPELPGYVFKGFYNKATNEYVYRLAVTDIDGARGLTRWEMLQKDVELEARYEVLKYGISYVDLNGKIQSPTNQTTYDGSVDSEVTLKAPAEISGYVFKYWYYVEIMFDGTENPPTRKVQCAKLPDVWSEGVIHTVGYQGDQPVYELTLFAEYEDAEYSVTFDYDAELLGLTVANADTSEPIVIGQDPLKVKYGTRLDVWVDISEIGELYKFDGIYVNGVNVSNDSGLGRPSNRVTVTVTEDSEIEIKVVPV